MMSSRLRSLLISFLLIATAARLADADAYFGKRAIRMKGFTYQTSPLFDGSETVSHDVKAGDFITVSFGVPGSVWRELLLYSFEFDVTVQEGRRKRSIHKERLNPSTTVEDRGWHTVTLPLKDFEGSSVEIRFSARTIDPKGKSKPSEGVLWGGLVVGGSRRAAGERNVILLSIDTLRADHLSLHGYDRPTSPNIDRIASQGVWFESAISQAPSTKPAHMSMFTGLRPFEHRIWKAEDHSELSAKIPTLPEILQRNGYLTQAYTGGVRVGARFGFARGFTRYEEFAQPDTRGDGPWVFGSAAEFIKRHKNDKFFLFLHTYEVHEPYKHRRFVRSEGKKRLKDVYDSGIFFVDSLVGDLFNSLHENGVADDTVLIIVSDHGEQLRTRPWLKTHGHSLYDDQIHIPMVFYMGKSLAPRKVSRFQSQHVDLMPTILDLAGIEHDNLSLSGQSLLPILRGEAPPAESRVVSEAVQYGDRDLESLRWMKGGQTYKYIYSPIVAAGRAGRKKIDAREKTRYWIRKVIAGGGREFYDLVADPKEENDLIKKESRTKDQMAKSLSEFLESRKSKIADRSLEPEHDLPEMDDESRELLRSLGY